MVFGGRQTAHTFVVGSSKTHAAMTGVASHRIVVTNVLVSTTYLHFIDLQNLLEPDSALC